MDVSRLEELKRDLLSGNILKHRRLLMSLGMLFVAFWTVTIIGGYFLVTHAMNDNQVSSRRDIDTPSKISLLFAGHEPSELINDLVFLNRVKLLPADSGDAFYISDDSGARLLVEPHGNKNTGEESVANVMGTLRPINAALLKKWKLSKAEQKEAKKMGVYLDAESVKVQKNSSTLAKR